MKLSPIIYVVHDIERALGMEPGANAFCNYFIIARRTPYAEKIQAKYPDNVWLVDAIGTYEILSLPEVIKSITKSTREEKAQLLVFKNAKNIETLAKEHGWNLLNPPAELAEVIENKITQVEWLGELRSYLPDHSVKKVRDIEMQKSPFIIQWAHSHTGDGTLLITTESQLAELKSKFPDREARVSAFIKGPTFTTNVIVGAPVTPDTTNISYQITGSLPFTDNPWSTIGNDWAVTHSLLSESHLKEVATLIEKLGAKMQNSGWKGIFGIDFMYDEERDQIRLIEINARQPASTTFESQIQLALRVAGIEGTTTFENHLLSLTGAKLAQAIHVNDGAQIVQRITKKILDGNMNPSLLPDIKAIDEAGYIAIPYNNTKLNSDLIRIQSVRGIMEAHNKFNSRGKAIIELVTK